MRSLSRTMGLAGLCCLAGCSTSQNVGSKYAKSQPVSATQGGTVTVTSADDPTLAGTSITIPPGALAKDTTITITEGDTISVPSGASLVGPVADFGPNGTAFSHPATITLPFQLAAGQSPADLGVVGVEGDGTVVVVDPSDVVVNASAGTLEFAAAGFTRFSAVHGGGSVLCPPGTALCGCCGSGRCLPAGVVCGIACPANLCHGGGTCCPAGQYFCGCGSTGTCIPDGDGCPLLCPAPAGTANGGPNSNPTCCPPGEYLCGCFGQGTCIPDNQACPALCPACDPTNPAIPPCPVNEICLNGQCVPGGTADAGANTCNPEMPCPLGETCCGCCGTGFCVPAGAATCAIACPQNACPVPRDGGTGCPCPVGEFDCGGTCVPDGYLGPCPVSTSNACCPVDYQRCNGFCIPDTALCAPPPRDGGSTPPADAGTCAAGSAPNCPCPAGEYECCGNCQPAGEVCPAICGVDAGSSCPTGEMLCGGCPSAQGGGPCVVYCAPACDGGTGVAGDAGAGCGCPPGEFMCGGKCVSSSNTNPCPVTGTNTCCPSGTALCNGKCIPDTLVCG
jgi:hypothetical protein